MKVAAHRALWMYRPVNWSVTTSFLPAVRAWCRGAPTPTLWRWLGPGATSSQSSAPLSGTRRQSMSSQVGTSSGQETHHIRKGRHFNWAEQNHERISPGEINQEILMWISSKYKPYRICSVNSAKMLLTCDLGIKCSIYIRPSNSKIPPRLKGWLVMQCVWLVIYHMLSLLTHIQF